MLRPLDHDGGDPWISLAPQVKVACGYLVSIPKQNQASQDREYN